MHFHVGDVVKLRSGGEEMTVKATVDEEMQIELGITDLIRCNVGDIHCNWFESKKFKQSAFHPSMLELVLRRSDKP